MKTITTLALAAALPLLFSQCKKADEGTFDTGFYSSDSTRALFLFVDGQAKGELPYFAEEPACASPNSDGVPPLQVRLPAGEYTVVGRDAQNVVRSSGTVWIGNSHNGLHGGYGAQRMSHNGTCVTIGLWE